MSNTRRSPINMFVACPCTGETLDRLLQPAILAVLAERPIHGYAITERIGELPSFAGNKPDVSGVYRYLKAIERRGLARSGWDVSDNGPAKKVYRITPAGRQCLQQWAETLEQYRDAITALLKTARRTVKKPRGRVCTS